jgi:hypothetical protein
MYSSVAAQQAGGTISRGSTLGFKALFIGLVMLALLLGGAGLVIGQSPSGRLHSLATIAGSGPYSFPGKAAMDRYGNIYLLDPVLSNIFVVNAAKPGSEPRALCSPRTPSTASDISIAGGGIWILGDHGSKAVRLDHSCHVQSSFGTRRPGLSLQANSAGEVIVLTGAGAALFDVYDQNGKLLRSFGERLSYGNPIADTVLSEGRIVSDRMGGFYFSFDYPPLVRHYGRDGKLLGEFKPASDIYIGPPNITSQQAGGRLTVRPNYQVLVLDLTLDDRGRLIFLLSGKSKSQAVSEGSQNLLVTNSVGKVLRKIIIEDTCFHRLVAGNGALYLLRNRDGLRLDKYVLP